MFESEEGDALCSALIEEVSVFESEEGDALCLALIEEVSAFESEEGDALCSALIEEVSLFESGAEETLSWPYTEIVERMDATVQRRYFNEFIFLSSPVKKEEYNIFACKISKIG